jgi:hypothetical protein
MERGSTLSLSNFELEVNALNVCKDGRAKPCICVGLGKVALNGCKVEI